MGNLLQPWWRQFGGKPEMLFYPKWSEYPDTPEITPWRLAKPLLVDILKGGRYGIVILDLIYLIITDELKNKLWETALLELQNILHKGTALVGTAHLKKQVQGQPLLHHVRGGTDLIGIPDRVMYLRKGKEKNQRVIVKLKDRATGDLDGGYITELAEPNGNMTIREVNGEPQEILKEYAKELAGEKKPDFEEDDIYIEVIRRQCNQFPRGTWESKKFTAWAKEILNLGQHKSRNLLRKAGFSTSPKDKQGPYFVF